MRADLSQWASCVSGAIEADAYSAMLREVGFVDVRVVDKVDAEAIVGAPAGAPRLFTARIVARKPT